MQVLFVIDCLKDIENKINILQVGLQSSFKFFIKTKLYAKVCTNKLIMDNLAGVYDRDVNAKIDAFIKSEKFELTDVVIYYSSVAVNLDMVKTITDKIPYKYDAIYFKKKENRFNKICSWFYKKVIKMMFGLADGLCSTKFQYISKEFVEHLIETKFNNHILLADNSSIVEMQDQDINKSLKTDFIFKKYHIFNIIGLFVTMLIFVLLEKMFNLWFWVYFLFAMLILMSIIVAIMLFIYNVFDNRYRKN